MTKNPRPKRTRRTVEQIQGPRNFIDPFTRRFTKFMASVSLVTLGADVSPRTFHLLNRAMVEA